jgi:hypothetical protein
MADAAIAVRRGDVWYAERPRCSVRLVRRENLRVHVNDPDIAVPRAVCERRVVRPLRSKSPDYQEETSERRSTGSVSTESGGRWMATLSVPITGGRGIVFCTLERHDESGEDDPLRCSEIALPEHEIDAVLALLRGVVRQARRDGVLAGIEGRRVTRT